MYYFFWERAVLTFHIVDGTWCVWQGEFSSVVGQLEASQAAQQILQRQVSTLQLERDLLLEELEKSGAISQTLRWAVLEGQGVVTC